MSNDWFDKALELAAGAGLAWTTAKFKAILVDMDDAGPAAGAWTINSLGFPVIAGDSYALPVVTNAAHGLSVGDRVAISGVTWVPSNWQASSAVSLGAYRKPTSSNGKLYKCVKAGTTGATQPTWPTTVGELVSSGATVSAAAIFQCVGTESNDPMNGLWPVIAVPNTTTFTIDLLNPYYGAASRNLTNARIANLSKTYLSEFVSSGGRIVTSAALTGKQILAGGILDCDNVPFTGVTGDGTEALIVVRAAALDADTDLADTAQRLVLFFGDLPGLPLPASPGDVTWQIPSTGLASL